MFHGMVFKYPYPQTCEYCEFIGDQFVKRMFTNETETIVLAYTQKVCAKVPSFLGKECTALVDKYGYYYLGELKKVRSSTVSMIGSNFSQIH